MTRILIAVAHPLMREGIRVALSGDRAGGFEIVAEAAAGRDVLSLVARHSPDVVLLDLRMPGGDGIDCLDRIVARHPDVKVVIFSSTADMKTVELAFKHSAHGFITKGIEPADLPSAIRQAVDGTAYHAHGLPALNLDSAAIDVGLTKREVDILRAAARGLSNKEVARELWVTEQTVKFHLTHVYRKLHVANRTEAARWAFASGLVDREVA